MKRIYILCLLVLTLFVGSTPLATAALPPSHERVFLLIDTLQSTPLNAFNIAATKEMVANLSAICNCKLVFVHARTVAQLQQKLELELKHHNRIDFLLVTGHGSSTAKDLTWHVGNELLKFNVNSLTEPPIVDGTGAAVPNIFSALKGKWSEHLVAQFANCSLMKGSSTVVDAKIRTLTDALGIADGSLYSNKSIGIAFNYQRSFTSLLPLRQSLLAITAIEITLATLFFGLSEANGFHLGAMQEWHTYLRAYAAIAAFGIGFDFFLTRIVPLMTHGYLVQLKNGRIMLRQKIGERRSFKKFFIPFLTAAPVPQCVQLHGRQLRGL